MTIDENVSQLLATPRKFWELMLHAEPLCIVARHPETFKVGQYLHTRSSKDSLGKFTVPCGEFESPTSSDDGLLLRRMIQNAKIGHVDGSKVFFIEGHVFP